MAQSKTPRLLIGMPPGSGKSTYTSVLFPAWLLAARPGCQIIGASHTDELAEDFSGRVQRMIREHTPALGYGLATESRGRWRTTNGGAYLAAGVGGAVPGFRADIAIVDDPIKSRAAANSDAERKRVWDWFLGDLERRLTPDGAIVLMHTRWHEDDLAGRLLAAQPGNWSRLTLPAEAEEDDQLGRPPGEWLWSDDDYGYGATLPQIKAGLEAAGAMSEWWSQYQQSPRQPGGTVFKTAQIAVLDAVPAGGKFVRGWDLAATRQIGSRDPDWTRGVLLQQTEDRRYIVVDVVSDRAGPDEIEAAIVNTAGQDRARYGALVRVGLPQDPGQAGKTQVLNLTRRLVGHLVVSSPETGDKATRAASVAAQCNVGNLAIVRGPWNPSFLDELGGFPTAAHDDQVDALSRAFSVFVEPMKSEGMFELYRARAEARKAQAEAAD